MTISQKSSPLQESTPENSPGKRWRNFPGIRYFINSQIGVKLNIGFSLLVGLTLLVIALSIAAGWITNKSISQVKDLRAPMVRISTEARSNLQKMIADLRGYLVLGDKSNIENYTRTKEKFQENLAQLNALSTRWKHLEHIDRFATMKKIYDEWAILAGRLFELHDSPRKNQPALRIAHLEIQPLNIPVMYDIESMIQIQKDRARSQKDLSLVEDMIMFHSSFETMIISLRAYATTGDISLKFSHALKLARNNTFLEKIKNSYSLLNEAQKSKFDRVVKNRQHILALASQIHGIMEGDRAYEDLYLFRTQALPRAGEMLRILDGITLEQQHLLQIDLDSGKKRLSRVQIQIFWSGIVALLLAMGLALVFKRSITLPIQRLTATAEKIAEGNLTATAQVESEDETGRLAETFNSMTTQLRETIGTLERHTTHLDELVNMRTSELVASKKELELEIIERKKIADTLAESEEKFRSIFETSPLGIIHMDRFGQVTAFNEILGHILGVSKGASIDFDQIKSRQDKAVINAISCALSGQKSQYEGDYFSVTRKVRTPIRANFAPIISDENKVMGVTGIVEDITERKKAEDEKEALEAQLRQALKMEAVGTLSGGIAHDFNNILGIIIGNAELAAEDVPEWNPARQNLDEIKTACLRARDVVRQLLSFSRKSDPLRKPLQINEIVTESMNLLRASIPTTIDIELNLPEKTETILADATQIHQVLINLCTNSAHAMEERGGTLKVDVLKRCLDNKTVFDYDGARPGTYVEIAVRDTGHGIDPWVQKKMFDPYYTTKEVGKGTGMGLAVVHGIVKNHNGAISVQSQPEKGTVIRVLFPLADAATASGESVSQDLLTGTETLLFLDDEIALVKMGKEMLERLGYTVETCTDPRDALALVREKPSRFDLIITDMTMPHLTGEQVAKEILEIVPGMPIILCTGFSRKVSQESVHEMGIQRYIEKPLNMREFARTIREVLDGMDATE